MTKKQYRRKCNKQTRIHERHKLKLNQSYRDRLRYAEDRAVMRAMRDTMKITLRASTAMLFYGPFSATMHKSSQMLIETIEKATKLMNQLTDEIAETEALRSELSN